MNDFTLLVTGSAGGIGAATAQRFTASVPTLLTSRRRAASPVPRALEEELAKRLSEISEELTS